MSAEHSNHGNAPEAPHLLRRFGLLEATALNMTNMIGIGPFITIPLLLTTLGGPQAMLGWLIALVITISDGMIWSELAMLKSPIDFKQVCMSLAVLSVVPPSTTNKLGRTI